MPHTQTVPAADVREGDRIFNAGAYHQSAAWVRVTAVENDGANVTIRTNVFSTHLHPRQAIAIQREEPV